MPTKKIRRAASTGDTARGEGITEFIDDLQAMTPRRQRRARDQASKPANGTTADADATTKDIELAGYRLEATERMAEAGMCLREWLVGSDDADLWDRWTKLTPGENEALGRATPLRAIEALIIRRVREHGRQAEEERKRNLKRVKYPSVSRGAFDNLDREPPATGGIVGGA